MKKVLAMMLVFASLMCLVCPAFAAVEETVQPRYTYVATLNGSISVNSTTGVATCKSWVSTYNSQRVRLLMHLQMYQNGRWQTLMTWEKTGTQIADMSKTKSVTIGGQYRLYVVGYVLDANGVILEAATLYDY